MGRIGRKKNEICNEDEDDWEFDESEEKELDYLCNSKYKGQYDDDDVDDDECDCEYDEEKLKNLHGISILMNVNSEDASVIRDALVKAGHVRTAEDFETRRELGIMHELKDKGFMGVFESWSKDTYGNGNCEKKPKYKMKHKIMAK